MKLFHLLILVCFFYPLANAQPKKTDLTYLIHECGIYSIEGYLTQESVSSDKKLVFIVEKDTTSEIRFDLGKMNLTQISLIGTYVLAQIQVTLPCSYTCSAKLIQIIKPLEPYEEPKPFLYPPTLPIQSLKCLKEKSTESASK